MSAQHYSDGKSLVSQECENQKYDPNNRQGRAAQDVLTAVQRRPLREGQKLGDNREACQYLNQIRNTLAHGTSPNDKEVKKMLKDEVKLNEGLKKIFDCLLPN